jgi:peptidoglycan/xylan/chitin deacetylase (PgdA/CDA1 family)
MKNWGWSLSTHHESPVTQIQNLEKEMQETKKAVAKWSDQKTARYFALPLGKYNPSVFTVLKKEFKAIRLAGGGFETLPVKDPYRLKTINITQQMPPEEVYQMCKKAIENKEWAILMFHYLGRPEKGDLNYSVENFKRLIEKLNGLKPYIKPMDWVL